MAQKMLGLPIITEEGRMMVRIPTHGPPTHPGSMLLEEFLKPLEMSQMGLAEQIGVSFPRVNELVHGKRGVTPDTALRLERLFGMEAQSGSTCSLPGISTMRPTHRRPKRSGRSGGCRPSPGPRGIDGESSEK